MNLLGTDFEKLQDILNNQVKSTVKSGDWDDLSNFALAKSKLKSRKGKPLNYVHIQLPQVDIDFVFNHQGRLVGICNYKE